MATSTTLYSGLAGLITILGILLTVRWHHSSLRYSHYINSFAAGFILAVALAGLLPRGLHENDHTPWFAVAGFIFFLILEIFLVVHSGAEIHYPQRRRAARGYVFFWGLFVHSLLDGVIIAVGFATNHYVGLITALAVITHELPEGITTFSLLLQQIADRRALWLAVLVALATPAGGIIGIAFLPDSPTVMGAATGVVVGSFIYIAASDIVPEIREKNAIPNLAALVAGTAFLFAAHSILKHSGMH